MASADDPNAPWPDGFDVLLFCGAIAIFTFGGIATFGILSDLLGLARVPEAQSMFQYGGTAVLIWLLFAGTFSFLMGGFVVRRMKRMRARWLSGVVGAIYAFVFTGLAILVPISRGGLAGPVLVAFVLLFPAVGLILGSLKLKRSISPLQTDRPQAGGS